MEMKKYFFAAVIGLMSASFIACDKDDEESTTDTTTTDTTEVERNVSGKLSVNFNSNNIVTDSVKCQYALNGGSITITLVDMKFVPQMPVFISPCLNNIPCTQDGDTTRFSAEKIVPTLNGNEFEKYTGTNVSGTLSKDGQIHFSLNFGDYPTEYQSYK